MTPTPADPPLPGIDKTIRKLYAWRSEFLDLEDRALGLFIVGSCDVSGVHAVCRTGRHVAARASRIRL